MLRQRDIADYVSENIGQFHRQRIECLERLTLMQVLRRKNPYLYRAKNLLTAEQIVRGVLDAHLSSNEETLFGDWLEGLAIFISGKVYGGRKSGIAGIDLEFDRDGARHIVAIKSGPNWGNSSQIKKMKSDFAAAKKTLRSSGAKLSIVAVNGYCYGRDRSPDKGEYYKYCGQRFWAFISGDADLYAGLIRPLGAEAQQRNHQFNDTCASTINRFTREFAAAFCKPDGAIDWDALVAFNSSAANGARRGAGEQQ